MKTLMIEQLAVISGRIEAAGIPALRVALAIAVAVFAAAGFFIFRNRRQFFDADPTVENDIPVVRHNRQEVIIFVWSGITLVLVYILYQVWSA